MGCGKDGIYAGLVVITPHTVEVIDRRYLVGCAIDRDAGPELWIEGVGAVVLCTDQLGHDVIACHEIDLMGSDVVRSSSEGAAEGQGGGGGGCEGNRIRCFIGALHQEGF